MGNRQLSVKEVDLLCSETGLEASEIKHAFEKFKKLAGDKGFVARADLFPLVQDIPIAMEVLGLTLSRDSFSGSAEEVDFRELLNVITFMRNKNSLMEYKVLFRMYDRDGDGIIGSDELYSLLAKISH